MPLSGWTYEGKERLSEADTPRTTCPWWKRQDHRCLERMRRIGSTDWRTSMTTGGLPCDGRLTTSRERWPCVSWVVSVDSGFDGDTSARDLSGCVERSTSRRLDLPR